MLPATAAMVFECGPWTGCPDGVECMYALTQRVRIHLLWASMTGSRRAHPARCHILPIAIRIVVDAPSVDEHWPHKQTG